MQSHKLSLTKTNMYNLENHDRPPIPSSLVLNQYRSKLKVIQDVSVNSYNYRDSRAAGIARVWHVRTTARKPRIKTNRGWPKANLQFGLDGSSNTKAELEILLRKSGLPKTKALRVSEPSCSLLSSISFYLVSPPRALNPDQTHLACAPWIERRAKTITISKLGNELRRDRSTCQELM